MCVCVCNNHASLCSFSQRVERLPGSLGGAWQPRPAEGQPGLGHQANLFPMLCLWPRGIIGVRRGGEVEERRDKRKESKGRKKTHTWEEMQIHKTHPPRYLVSHAHVSLSFPLLLWCALVSHAEHFQCCFFLIVFPWLAAADRLLGYVQTAGKSGLNCFVFCVFFVVFFAHMWLRSLFFF